MGGEGAVDRNGRPYSPSITEFNRVIHGSFFVASQLQRNVPYNQSLASDRRHTSVPFPIEIIEVAQYRSEYMSISISQTSLLRILG